MAFTQITALWTGAAGLPGYTRFKFLGDLDSTAAAAAASTTRDFFNEFRAYVPEEATVTWDGLAQVFDGNGVLTGEVSYTPLSPVAGTSVVSYAAGMGCAINWHTGAIRNGRPFRGRTFVVPLTSAAFDGAGAPSVAFREILANAASLVYGEPVPLVIYGGPLPGVSGTEIAVVNGASVSPKAAFLRSRRD